jgi:DNA invertase Pin-like site-specific DNA recombinase
LADELGYRYETFIDQASGKDLNRPAWQEMMGSIRRGRFKAVLVLRIDRAFRSVIDGALTLQEFEALGVRFIPSHERHFDTGTPIGKAAVHMSMVSAELERETIRSRVMDGLNRAVQEGKRLGRPRRRLGQDRAIQAVEEHGGIAAAAVALRVSESTLRRRLSKTQGTAHDAR